MGSDSKARKWSRVVKHLTVAIREVSNAVREVAGSDWERDFAHIRDNLVSMRESAENIRDAYVDKAVPPSSPNS